MSKDLELKAHSELRDLRRLAATGKSSVKFWRSLDLRADYPSVSPSSFPQIVSSCLLHARSCFGYSGTTVQIQIRFFLSVGSCLAGGAGQDLCGWRQRGSRQLLDVPAHGSRGSVLRPVVPLRAPLGPRHGPARLGARPQPNPHVGSSTSAWLPTDVSLAVPFKAPQVPSTVSEQLLQRQDLTLRAADARQPDVHSRYGRPWRALRPRGRVSEVSRASWLRSAIGGDPAPGGIGAASQRRDLETWAVADLTHARGTRHTLLLL